MTAEDTPVALVSGAASGIGRAVATELRGRGWEVVGLDRHPGEDRSCLQVDMADADAVARVVTDVERRTGRIDGVVSAAGHYAIVPLAEISLPQWRDMLRVHVGGLLHLSRACLPGMRARGSGSIVAVTSELALGGGDGEAHYAAAKGAVIGLVRSLAAEVAGHGVRVNAVAPGPTDTAMLDVDSPWRDPTYLRTLPARRLARAEEVALVTAHLLVEATFTTGEVVSPNSGAVI